MNERYSYNDAPLLRDEFCRPGEPVTAELLDGLGGLFLSNEARAVLDAVGLPDESTAVSAGEFVLSLQGDDADENFLKKAMLTDASGLNNFFARLSAQPVLIDQSKQLGFTDLVENAYGFKAYVVRAHCVAPEFMYDIQQRFDGKNSTVRWRGLLEQDSETVTRARQAYVLMANLMRQDDTLITRSIVEQTTGIRMNDEASSIADAEAELWS